VKLLLIISALITCCCCKAQKLDLQRVFDYLNSTEFRKACKDSIAAKWHNNRKGVKTDTLFLKANVCFIPYHYYVVKRKDTSNLSWLDRRAVFDTFPSGRYYAPAEICNSLLYLEVKLIDDGKLLIEYYSFQDMFDFPVRFGESTIFTLQLNDDKSITFKRYGRLYR